VGFIIHLPGVGVPLSSRGRGRLQPSVLCSSTGMARQSI